jgi:hypothetical protein
MERVLSPPWIVDLPQNPTLADPVRPGRRGGPETSRLSIREWAAGEGRSGHQRIWRSESSEESGDKVVEGGARSPRTPRRDLGQALHFFSLWGGIY